MCDGHTIADTPPRSTAEGAHMLSFGESGTDDGQFYCPHNIDMRADGRLLVADRENRSEGYDTEQQGHHA